MTLRRKASPFLICFVFAVPLPCGFVSLALVFIPSHHLPFLLSSRVLLPCLSALHPFASTSRFFVEGDLLISRTHTLLYLFLSPLIPPLMVSMFFWALALSVSLSSLHKDMFILPFTLCLMHTNSFSFFSSSSPSSSLSSFFSLLSIAVSFVFPCMYQGDKQIKTRLHPSSSLPRIYTPNYLFSFLLFLINTCT